MTAQLREQVQSLAAQNVSEYSIHKRLKPEFPDLTRHRVRVLMSERPEPELARFQLPERKPPIYQGGKSITEHAEAWETVDQSLQNHYWYLGAIAASLDRSYGRGSIKDLAELVGKSPERIYQLLRTYRAFEGKDVSGQLTFTHFQYAADSDKPDYWIRRAHDEGLSTRKLEILIKGKPLPDFRIVEPETVDDAAFRPVTEGGYSEFPPSEASQGVTSEEAAQLISASLPPQTLLSRWFDYVRSHGCYICNSPDTEAAHVECLPSTKQSGLIPRLKGLGKWPCLPLCAHHHRTGNDSVHSVGEAAFFEAHRGKDHAIGYVMRLLLEFFLE